MQPTLPGRPQFVRPLPQHVIAMQQQARMEQQQKEAEALLKTRREWIANQCAPKRRYTERGVTISDVRRVLQETPLEALPFQDKPSSSSTPLIKSEVQEDEISEDALRYICDSLNEVLMDLMCKASKNAWHRKAHRAEPKDVLLAIDSKSAINKIMEKSRLAVPWYDVVSSQQMSSAMSALLIHVTSIQFRARTHVCAGL